MNLTDVAINLPVPPVYNPGVSIHWTGLLDWNTGLDYWTELFSFFGQVSVFILERSLHVATPFYNQQVHGYYE